MATSSIVNTLGAGSGIDVKSLAQSLVDAEKIPKKERIDAKISQSEAKISGYSAIKFALTELNKSFGALNNTSDFGAIKASNTQPAAFGVTTTTKASASNYTIEVSQLAKRQRTMSTLFESPTTSVNNGVAFQMNLVIGTKETTIDVSAPPTPASITDAINNSQNDVIAQLVESDQGTEILLTGKPGKANSFSLEPISSDSVNAETPISFSNTLQAAQNSTVYVNGLIYTSSSNTLKDVIPGVTLELNTVTSGEARLDLTLDTTGIKEKIKGLITAYNDFEETLKILGDKSSEVEGFGGALAGESLLQSVRSQVRRLITDPFGKTDMSSSPLNPKIKAVRDIGLSIDEFGKMIPLNDISEKKLDATLQNNFNDIVTMFAGTNSPSFAGVADLAIKSLNKMTLSGGLLDSQSSAATTQISKYKEDLMTLEDRMEKLMTRYMSQFSIMESMVGNSNSLRNSLKGTFEGMMKAYTS